MQPPPSRRRQPATQSAGLHDLAAMAADDGDVQRWAGIGVPALLMQDADSWLPIPKTMQQLADVLPQVKRRSGPGRCTSRR